MCRGRDFPPGRGSRGRFALQVPLAHEARLPAGRQFMCSTPQRITKRYMCRGRDLNPHALKRTPGPQPGLSTNSSTTAYTVPMHTLMHILMRACVSTVKHISDCKKSLPTPSRHPTPPATVRAHPTYRRGREPLAVARCQVCGCHGHLR